MLISRNQLPIPQSRQVLEALTHIRQITAHFAESAKPLPITRNLQFRDFGTSCILCTEKKYSTQIIKSYNETLSLQTCCTESPKMTEPEDRLFYTYRVCDRQTAEQSSAEFHGGWLYE